MSIMIVQALGMVVAVPLVIITAFESLLIRHKRMHPKQRLSISIKCLVSKWILAILGVQVSVKGNKRPNVFTTPALIMFTHAR
jgi:hypothetical protein